MSFLFENVLLSYNDLIYESCVLKPHANMNSPADWNTEITCRRQSIYILLLEIKKYVN